MAHTFTALFNHIIFSTKQRQPSLQSEIRPRLFPYIAGVIRNLGGIPILINGVEDHIHILTNIPATTAMSDFLRDIKSNSSSWVKETFALPDFAWQGGYAALSVSKSNVVAVRKYIANQIEHHPNTIS